MFPQEIKSTLTNLFKQKDRNLVVSWWASLYLNLIRVETDSIDVDTMAVDGTHLFFNPKFTESLTDKECIGVLMHETAHCALLHCYRRKYREPLRWNVACDKAVNAILAAANIKLPDGYR
jgi:predicted metal-dependent peptidase